MCQKISLLNRGVIFCQILLNLQSFITKISVSRDLSLKSRFSLKFMALKSRLECIVCVWERSNIFIGAKDANSFKMK